MIRRTVYIPMTYDDKGEPTVPDWNYEGEDTPDRALIEALGDWENAAEMRDHQTIILAKCEETDEIPPENEWEALRNACEGAWSPGDEWRKWIGCVEVRITTREIPKP
jgi:hypothetical protein